MGQYINTKSIYKMSSVDSEVNICGAQVFMGWKNVNRCEVSVCNMMMISAEDSCGHNFIFFVLLTVLKVISVSMGRID
jgi:hypothetical protein